MSEVTSLMTTPFGALNAGCDPTGRAAVIRVDELGYVRLSDADVEHIAHKAATKIIDALQQIEAQGGDPR